MRALILLGVVACEAAPVEIEVTTLQLERCVEGSLAILAAVDVAGAPPALRLMRESCPYVVHPAGTPDQGAVTTPVACTLTGQSGCDATHCVFDQACVNPLNGEVSLRGMVARASNGVELDIGGRHRGKGGNSTWHIAGTLETGLVAGTLTLAVDESGYGSGHPLGAWTTTITFEELVLSKLCRLGGALTFDVTHVHGESTYLGTIDSFRSNGRLVFGPACGDIAW